jgi:hypothetical protein
MDTNQALNILLQAAQLAAMPAQAHIQCQQAYDLLAKALKPIDANE